MKKVLVSLAVAAVLWGCDKDDSNNNNEVSSADKNFAFRASLYNSAEIDGGQLASTKGTNQETRDFGTLMVADYGTASSDLKAIASSLSIEAPDSIDADHIALKNQLNSLSGSAFDSLYIHSQVADQQMAISLFENEFVNGQNVELRNYANQLLPKLRAHLAKADSLANAFPQ